MDYAEVAGSMSSIKMRVSTDDAYVDFYLLSSASLLNLSLLFEVTSEDVIF